MVVEPYIVGHDQLLFFGGAFMLGASPGLISSGVAAFTVSAGRDSGVARSVVVAGMHPGRAGADAQTCSDLTSDIGYPGRTGDVAAVTIFFEG